MRQGQQHTRRARGRGRRPQNQNNRVFDSNGPDVKVRGTASTIAEKYITLSRDAQSAGDRVAAENYLQHAEHYLRIVEANKPQVSAPQPQPDISAEQDEKKEPAQTEADGQGDPANMEEADSDKPAPRPRRTRTPRGTSERGAARKPRSETQAESQSEDAKKPADPKPAPEANTEADDGVAAA